MLAELHLAAMLETLQDINVDHTALMREIHAMAAAIMPLRE